MIPHGTVKAIIVVNLDRLCRSLTDFCKLLEVLIRYDVSLYSKDQRIDTSSAMGRFFANSLVNVAEFESSLIGERIKRGHDQKYFEGKKGPGLRPFGWIEDKDGFLVREDEEQRIIDLIVARRAKGVSWRDCADILNEMTSKPVKTDKWTAESLRGVMRSAMRRREMDAERGAQKKRE
jgi:DNA invertase Pin-like site-specific DNA recombinase